MVTPESGYTRTQRHPATWRRGRVLSIYAKADQAVQCEVTVSVLQKLLTAMYVGLLVSNEHQ